MRLIDYVMLVILCMTYFMVLRISSNVYKITEVNCIRLEDITTKQAIMINKVLNACKDGRDDRILKEFERYVDSKGGK